MPTLSKHKTIPKNTSTQDDLDFQFLKKKGIEYIESLGGSLWSDYNSHDPGKTILEVLSYALTDLGNRINLPVEVLLAEENNASALKKQFLTAEKALPIKPITPLDYRKLFIDLDGVKNAWLKKHVKKVYANCKDLEMGFQPFEVPDNKQKSFVLNGLYDVLIEVDDSYEGTVKDLKENVRKAYHANRNLCEDIIHIEEVDEHPVKICAQIELLPDADDEYVHALVLKAIDDYLSPNLRFYSLKGMLEKGYTTDEIYNGPLLSNGFIDTEELRNTELKKEIRLSDLIDIIQKIEGVDVIRDITIDHCDGTSDGTTTWNICIPEGKKPTRCDKSAFSYYKGFLPLNINQQEVENYLIEFEEAEEAEASQIASESKVLQLPNAEGQTLGRFTTIQNDFPEVYGVGQIGVRPSAPTEDKAKVKQLKGYLLFFDQILATYFAHLQKVKELFSIDGELSQSYFTQLVEDVKDLPELVSANYTSNENITELLLSDLDETIVRRNQILDHLLSRFAENFSEYAFLMKQLYGSYTDQAVIKTKERFLKEYGIIGCERGLSFNYYKQLPANLWDTNNVSAFQKRIALLSGNPDYSRRNFSDDPLEIYEEVDTDGYIEYRFRFRDASSTILGSGSKHYHSLASLYKEILDVKNYGRFAEHYEIKTSISGKFYFNLTNPNYPDPGDERHVIARRIAYYNTQQNAENAIENVVEFMNELQPNEGMYLIEHILLRPDVTKETMNKDYFLPICEDNCESCEGVDPYSFRVSIVLPGWTERYSNVDFRKFMEDLIQKELPSHIMAKICWIGWPKSYKMEPGEENEMVEMEEAYQAWLLSKTNNGQKQHKAKLMRLNKIVSSLHTIYTQGRLHDCDDDEEQQNIILGRTNLGII
ncbi:MAG TPA: hypothetical protein DCS66_11190 [Flavobacteriaceae bacterium]|nr:hypothetical protein [Flavobacteriaceae bacterium]